MRSQTSHGRSMGERGCMPLCNHTCTLCRGLKDTHTARTYRHKGGTKMRASAPRVSNVWSLLQFQALHTKLCGP